MKRRTPKPIYFHPSVIKKLLIMDYNSNLKDGVKLISRANMIDNHITCSVIYVPDNESPSLPPKGLYWIRNSDSLSSIFQDCGVPAHEIFYYSTYPNGYPCTLDGEDLSDYIPEKFHNELPTYPNNKSTFILPNSHVVMTIFSGEEDGCYELVENVDMNLNTHLLLSHIKDEKSSSYIFKKIDTKELFFVYEDNNNYECHVFQKVYYYPEHQVFLPVESVDTLIYSALSERAFRQSMGEEVNTYEDNMETLFQIIRRF